MNIKESLLSKGASVVTVKEKVLKDYLSGSIQLFPSSLSEAIVVQENQFTTKDYSKTVHDRDKITVKEHIFYFVLVFAGMTAVCYMYTREWFVFLYGFSGTLMLFTVLAIGVFPLLTAYHSRVFLPRRVRKTKNVLDRMIEVDKDFKKVFEEGKESVSVHLEDEYQNKIREWRVSHER